jgi:hypothetical protein
MNGFHFFLLLNAGVFVWVTMQTLDRRREAKRDRERRERRRQRAAGASASGRQ